MKAIVEPLAPLLGCGWDTSRTRGHLAPLQVPLFPPTVHAHLRAFVLLPAASQSSREWTFKNSFCHTVHFFAKFLWKLFHVFDLLNVSTRCICLLSGWKHTLGDKSEGWFFFSKQSSGTLSVGFWPAESELVNLKMKLLRSKSQFSFLFVIFLHSLSSICERGSGSYSGGCERRDCTAAM